MRQTMQLRVPVWETKASKPLDVKTCGSWSSRETTNLTGEFVGETHRVLEGTQSHPPGNQHQKDLICLWVVGEVTECWRKPSKWHCSLSDPSPTYSTIMKQHMLPHPGEYQKLHPLQCNRCTKTMKYGPKNRSKLQKKYN